MEDMGGTKGRYGYTQEHKGHAHLGVLENTWGHLETVWDVGNLGTWGEGHLGTPGDMGGTHMGTPDSI